MILNDDSLMPFGKYKGTPMKDVPAEYLDWFVGENDGEGVIGQAVCDYVERNRKVIDAELEGRA